MGVLLTGAMVDQVGGVKTNYDPLQPDDICRRHSHPSEYPEQNIHWISRADYLWYVGLSCTDNIFFNIFYIPPPISHGFQPLTTVTRLPFIHPPRRVSINIRAIMASPPTTMRPTTGKRPTMPSLTYVLYPKSEYFGK